MRRSIRLIVPAAGAGTRMGIPYPKTLALVSGKPILGHILAAVAGLVESAVVVASPIGAPFVREYLRSIDFFPIEIAIQPRPIGMADAVEVGLQSFDRNDAPDYLIIWGDQVTVRRSTVETIIESHQNNNAWLTFPTCRRNSPYIHVDRDAIGEVRGVLEAREGDAMPVDGESDCGVFLVRGDRLLHGLSELRRRTWDAAAARFRRLDGKDSVTGEFNFLPLITLWAQSGGVVLPLPVAGSEEALGVNTPAEAALAEQILDRN